MSLPDGSPPQGHHVPQPPQGAPPTMQLLTRTRALEASEVAALEQLTHDSDDWCAVEMDVPQFGVQGVQPDGSKVWTATFVTPPEFFKFEDTKLLGPDGQPANLKEQFAKTFLQGVFPFVRFVCRRERIGDHVPFPPRNDAERAEMKAKFQAAAAQALADANSTQVADADATNPPGRPTIGDLLKGLTDEKE